MPSNCETIKVFVDQTIVQVGPVDQVIAVVTAGAQGPAGPAGPTGPVGPTGPAGDQVMNYRSVAIDYVVDFDTDKWIDADSSGDPIFITLPASAGNAGKSILVKKVDPSIFAVIINTLGLDLIDGLSTFNIESENQQNGFFCTGTGYRVF